eukprot:457684-Lingulodinium_polyedra.AAC.1
MAALSPTCAAHLEKVEMMLKEPEEVARVAAEAGGGSPPYVDPALRADIIPLAVRMARVGMVRAVRRARMEVGLFT